MKHQTYFSAVLFALMCLATCSPVDDVDIFQPPASDPIAITVGSGTTPQYSWTGGNLTSLRVQRTAEPGTAVWGVNGSAITSPLTHGTTPPGTTQFGSELTLTTGVDYTVTAERIAGGEWVIGAQHFRP